MKKMLFRGVATALVTPFSDDGTKIELKDFLCFAEKVHNKY